MAVKEQIVISSKMRRTLGKKKGTRVQVDLDNETRQIILTPITGEFAEGMRGRFKGKGLHKALAAARKREREMEMFRRRTK